MRPTKGVRKASFFGNPCHGLAIGKGFDSSSKAEDRLFVFLKTNRLLLKAICTSIPPPPPPPTYWASGKMGSGRDKRKKAKPKAPGAGAEKTSRKTERNEGKAVKRAAQAAKVNPSIPDTLFFRAKALHVSLILGISLE